MNNKMKLTRLQKDYAKNADKRWNIKAGGTHSGKRYANIIHTIPYRLNQLKNEDGEILFTAYTKGNAELNIIERLQRVWGKRLVSDVKGNISFVFGHRVHVYGASRSGQKNLTKLLEESKLKYVYGDEIATWSENVFRKIKLNLELNGGIADAVMLSNRLPDWIKHFISNEKDLFYQHYTIYDNELIPKEEKKRILEYYKNDMVNHDEYIIGEKIVRNND